MPRTTSDPFGFLCGGGLGSAAVGGVAATGRCGWRFHLGKPVTGVSGASTGALVV